MLAGMGTGVIPIPASRPLGPKFWERRMNSTTWVGVTKPGGLRAKWHGLRESRWAYVFISPFFLLFLVFGVYPLVFSFILSFTNWNGKGPLNFINFNNYKLLLLDRVFWHSVQNGVILFLMYVPIMIFLATVLAVILNSKRVRGFQFFRTLIFLPYITNVIAAGFVFQLLLSTNYGLFNQMLAALNIPPIAWLDSVWGARVSLSLLVIWGWLGYNMVLILAGLQTIPGELAEAALIDGANPVQAFFYITVPLLQPVLLFCIILSTMGSFNLFGELVSLFPSSGGAGPLQSTITPLLAIYGQAFGNFKFGYASTQAYAYFALIFLVTLFQLKYFNRGQA
jgi:lactose/L-arabinose transport system permease protein